MRHRSWARVLSALVAGLSLLVDGLALVWSVIARLAGEPAPFDPFLLVTIVAWLVVLFAVLRRW